MYSKSKLNALPDHPFKYTYINVSIFTYTKISAIPEIEENTYLIAQILESFVVFFIFVLIYKWKLIHYAKYNLWIKHSTIIIWLVRLLYIWDYIYNYTIELNAMNGVTVFVLSRMEFSSDIYTYLNARADLQTSKFWKYSYTNEKLII